MSLERQPELAVVVIGRNEGPRLMRCLESVRRMEFPPEGLEMIYYVDSGSTDASVENARKEGVRVVELQPRRPTAALARNAGWRAATAPFLLFLDGDCTIDTDFVRRALPYFEDSSVAIVFGKLREENPCATIFHRVQNLDWWNPAPGPSSYCAGVFLARREAVEKAGGFGEALVAGEEPELCARLRGQGYVILHVDIPMARHELAMTHWSQYWRRLARRGYGTAQLDGRLTERRHFLRREAQRSRVWAPMLLAASAGALLGSAACQSFVPLAGYAVFAGGLTLGTAWAFRKKTADPATLLLYSIHWHVRLFPILWGQLLCWFDRWRGETRRTIEYKSSPGA